MNFFDQRAPLFLQTNRSDKNDNKEQIDARTFVVENEAYSIMLGLFSLYKMSILVYFDNLTDNTNFSNYVNIST